MVTTFQMAATDGLPPATSQPAQRLDGQHVRVCEEKDFEDEAASGKLGEEEASAAGNLR